MPPPASLVSSPASSSRNDFTWLAENSTALHSMRRAQEEDEGLGARLSVMGIIFVVSLFAASFPTLSHRIKFLRIPRIIFFIGKHFGTGVILSTAFVHLLQDAFEALAVSGRISDFTGLIILGSLLCIFLVEYISTSYVDTLQSYSSPPSTPPSPASSLPTTSSAITPAAEIPPVDTADLASQGVYTLPESPTSGDERMPLIQPPVHKSISQILPRSSRPPLTQPRPKSMYTRPSQSYFPSRRQSYHSHTHTHTHTHTGVEADVFDGGHHRHESRSHHASHVGGRRRSLLPDELEAELSREADEAQAQAVHRHQHQHHGHAGHSHAGGWGSEDEFEHLNDGEEGEVKVGRKRGVVGILVLQLGIMIHSLVIGLTLAITSGGGFTSLVFAIIFHQLFEGLSLGIRIAQLPTSSSQSPHHKNDDQQDSAPHHPWHLRFLKPTLTLLFALTTPLGILLGLFLFSPSSSPSDPWLTLTRGVMCAISAGMLIYAATVEMLAADFVMDPASWRAGPVRQGVALGSLVAGVVGMSLVGMLD